jgi:hypothetical protein
LLLLLLWMTLVLLVCLQHLRRRLRPTHCPTSCRSSPLFPSSTPLQRLKKQFWRGQ